MLDELSGYAPVQVVRGNNDGPDVAAWGAPETLELDLAGLAVAMVHDSGPAAGRCARLRRRFPAAVSARYAADGTRRAPQGGPSVLIRRPAIGVEDGQLARC